MAPQKTVLTFLGEDGFQQSGLNVPDAAETVLADVLARFFRVGFEHFRDACGFGIPFVEDKTVPEFKAFA